MIWHTYAYIELFALNTVHVLYFYLREMAFHTKKQNKKDFDTQQVLCFI